MINIHIKVTFKQPKKTLGFNNLWEKTFLGKKSQLFRHFSPTTAFPDKIFYPRNTFLQTEVKVKLDDKFLVIRNYGKILKINSEEVYF